MTVTIKPSDLCKRLAVKNYPILLITAISSYYHFKGLFPGTTFSFYFILCSIGMIYFWALIILALSTLRPVGILNRLMVMAGTFLLGFFIPYIGFALKFDFNPLPFSGSLISSRIFIMALLSGAVVIWIFISEEQSLIAEKAYAEEKAGRILSEKKLVENRLNLLQAQIEPRFLFNTMKTILGLFDRAPEKAMAMQMHFIQYLRATLVKTRKRISTLSQEMELIRSYLDIFKVSMGERLEYHFDIDPQTMELTFPSMLLQPVVENAIKYGLEEKPEGGCISISVERREAMIHIEIADTCNGLDEEERMAIILSDLKERIGSFFGDKGRLRFEENNPSGLIVIIEVPYG
jgi:sensor histidine kinase YesM